MEFTAEAIAGFLKGDIEGNPDIKVNTVAKIEEGHPGALSFLANPKYEHYIYTTRSSVILVNKSFVPSEKIDATLIRVENAYEAFASLLRLVDQARPRKKGIHPTAVIESTAKIGKDVYIGPYAYIGENCIIEDGCSLYPHVYIGDNTKVGKNCMFGGQVGIAGHIKIANGTKIGAQAGILGDVKEENTVILGSPAIEIKQFLKSSVIFKRLPDLKVKIDALEKEVESLKKR